MATPVALSETTVEGKASSTKFELSRSSAFLTGFRRSFMMATLCAIHGPGSFCTTSNEIFRFHQSLFCIPENRIEPGTRRILTGFTENPGLLWIKLDSP